MRSGRQWLVGVYEGLVGPTHLGAAYEVELPAYENDVLHALVRGGGLPGLGAADEIVIYRGLFATKKDAEEIKKEISKARAEGKESAVASHIVRIPLKLKPGEELELKPEDVILKDGDVVFIGRKQEFFFTGGLLPSGMYPLPREFDLDVLQAVALVGGTLFNGGFSGYANWQGQVVAGGMGDITPSKLLVIRKLPDGRQVPIYVDLNLALRDPRYRILVQPGDFLILQQTPGEAIGRYLTRVFNFTTFWQVWTRQDASGEAVLSVP